MPVTEYLGVRLNMNNTADRAIYDKLQGYPKGEKSKIMKEALLQYLNGADGEKGIMSKVKEVKMPLMVKEAQKPLVVDTHNEEQVPPQDVKDVLIIEKEGDKSEEARRRLKKMIY